MLSDRMLIYHLIPFMSRDHLCSSDTLGFSDPFLPPSCHLLWHHCTFLATRTDSRAVKLELQGKSFLS